MWLFQLLVNTGYIGLHRVHQLNVRIPYYRLTDCHNGSSMLARVLRRTLRDGLTTTWFKLWDKEAGGG